MIFIKEKFLNFIKLILPAVILIIVWQLYIFNVPENEFYLGSPLGIQEAFITLIAEGLFFNDLFTTFFEALIGLIIGCVTGSIVGLLLWYSQTVQKIARPYILLLGSIPVFALAPMLIFWFGSSMLSKIIIVFLSTFFIALTQSFNGASVKMVDYEELFRSLKASKNQTFYYLIIPSALIWVLAGLRLSISFSILGAFIGELISSQSGLGHMIMVAEGLFDINGIWVGIFGLLIIAFIFNLLLTPLELWAKNKRLS